MDIEELNRILEEEEATQPPPQVSESSYARNERNNWRPSSASDESMKPQPTGQAVTLSIQELKQLFQQSTPAEPTKPKRKQPSKKKLESLAKARQARKQKSVAKQTGQLREYSNTDIEQEVQKRVMEILEQYQQTLPPTPQQQYQQTTYIPRNEIQEEHMIYADQYQQPQIQQQQRLNPMSMFQAPVDEPQRLPVRQNVATRNDPSVPIQEHPQPQGRLLSKLFNMR